VLATQNPIEQEGTYPLPEAQLDRFFFKLLVPYSTREELAAILQRTTTGHQADVEAVRTDDAVLDYLVAVVTATRNSPLLTLGVSPRGSLALLRAAQAGALADGRDYLVPDDIKGLAVAALAHRVIPRASGGHGEAPRLDAEAVIRALVNDVPVPR